MAKIKAAIVVASLDKTYIALVLIRDEFYLVEYTFCQYGFNLVWPGEKPKTKKERCAEFFVGKPEEIIQRFKPEFVASKESFNMAAYEKKVDERLNSLHAIYREKHPKSRDITYNFGGCRYNPDLRPWLK